MADVPSRVIELVETFDRDIDAYRSPQYNETQLRREFIDPLFEQLGWDVANKAGHAHAYKDVIHEDAISVGSATKAPDYCFRIGGTRKFFLEAKKPSINIKDDPHPAYQLRRYAWSAGLPLSILTDFEEFAVYDCQIKPNQKDGASAARIMYFTYNQYHDRWSEIAGIFSRDAILKGSFDKFAASARKKRGTTTVDVVFLAEIEKWRDMLAKIIALRNRNLSQPEINFAVQCTIDRILFLRMCEDRGIERYGQLQSISSGDRTYPRLCEIFERADQRYNSGLFHFHDESGRTTPPDTLTPSITIDDKDLKWILYNLYYPQCPYEFSVLPPEILGNVYEQFLGKVITLTPAHHAKIEEKPEVKKAGGVYYTPSYIVDYIVKNTVGNLIEGKTPKQIENIKILDPACGSGSFLLGAYTCLLNYHRDWYVAHNSSKHSKKIYQGRGGHHFLTIAEKKRILLNNIFGVDIDSQAVEVTKLSLLLKVLEGENSQTLESQYRLFHERALPDLASNIKCGNSLIAPDFFDNNVIPSAVEESNKTRHCEEARPDPGRRTKLGEGASKQRNTQYPIRNTNNDLYQKINPFDWKIEFPQIFSRKPPGFDAVIGNPPWGATFTEQELAYHKVKNQEIIVRMIDSFMYFFYQSSTRLNAHGTLGMILPDVIRYQCDNLKLRQYVLENFTIRTILNMGDVFYKVTRPASILIIEKGSNSKNQVTVADFSAIRKDDKESAVCDPSNFKQLPQHLLQQLPGKLFITSALDKYQFVNKISAVPHESLKTLTDQDGIQRGVSPDLKEAFIVSSATAHDRNLEGSKLRNILTGGRHVKRFFIDHPDLRLIYTTRNDDFSKLPNICAFIDTFRESITCREVSQGKHPLHSLHRPRKESIFLKKVKLIGVITGDRIIVAADNAKTFATDGLYLFAPREGTNPGYLLGILNSTLFVFLYRLLALEKGRVLAQVKPTLLSELPIRTIDFANPDDKAMHDKMVKLVERMLDLHKKLAAARVPDEKTKIQRQIDTTDRQIDHLVYQLYDLTEEEIKIVEQSTDQNAHK